MNSHLLRSMVRGSWDMASISSSCELRDSSGLMSIPLLNTSCCFFFPLAWSALLGRMGSSSSCISACGLLVAVAAGSLRNPFPPKPHSRFLLPSTASGIHTFQSSQLASSLSSLLLRLLVPLDPKPFDIPLCKYLPSHSHIGGPFPSNVRMRPLFTWGPRSNLEMD